MIGGNSCGDIARGFVTAKSWRVSIDRLSCAFRRGDLGQDFAVAAENAGPIHHLREIGESFIGEQSRHRSGVERRARRFKRGRGNAAGNAKRNGHTCVSGFAKHELHPHGTEHIGDLMRITHRGHSAVTHRNARKFARRQHAALDMNMRIDEPGHDETRVNHRIGS